MKITRSFDKFYENKIIYQILKFLKTNIHYWFG